MLIDLGTFFGNNRILTLAVLFVAGMFVFHLIIKPHRLRRIARGRYEHLLGEFGGVGAIQCGSVMGSEDISDACRIIAHEDALEIVRIYDFTSCVKIPYENIQSFRVDLRANHPELPTERSKAIFYSENAERLVLNVLGKNGSVKHIYAQMSSAVSERVFNRYALEQNNFYEYLKSKAREETNSV